MDNNKKISLLNEELDDESATYLKETIESWKEEMVAKLQEEVEQAKALKALSQTIEYINHKTIEDPHTEVIMSDEPSIIEATPLSQDLERMEALFEKGIGIKEGGYVHWIEKDGQEKIIEELHKED